MQTAKSTANINDDDNNVNDDDDVNVNVHDETINIHENIDASKLPEYDTDTDTTAQGDIFEGLKLDELNEQDIFKGFSLDEQNKALETSQSFNESIEEDENISLTDDIDDFLAYDKNVKEGKFYFS